MTYREFTYGLGDMVLSYQVLEDNLASSLKKKGDIHALLKESLSLLPKDLGEEIAYLLSREGYYFHEIGLSFIDADNLEEDPAFEKACAELTADHKRIYAANSELLKRVLEKKN